MKRKHAKRLAALAALLATPACAPSKVEPLQTYQGPALPRPAMVVVTDFAVNPDDVTLDPGIGAKLRSRMSGTSSAAQQSEDERKVTAAISNTLVSEIRKLGLPAIRGSGAEPGAGDTLIVDGQILSINEGNRTRRNLIGLGAGHSEVEARAELYYQPPATAPQLVESFTADAQSSRKPGAAETMGAGAASGRVAESALMTGGTSAAPSLQADVESDGRRLGQALAKQLGQFFASQGWIPAAR